MHAPATVIQPVIHAFLTDTEMQDLRELRDKIKTKMAAALNELRNMQALEDMLEKAQVCRFPNMRAN